MSSPDPNICALCYHPKADAATCNRPDCELSSPSACSASGTPETDAAERGLDGRLSATLTLLDFARRLERERDEARQLAEEYWLDHPFPGKLPWKK